MAAAFTIQRYLNRRCMRALLRDERACEAAYGRHPVIVLYEELEAAWDRLAPLYPGVLSETDRWAS
jgi:hypothetical protein